MYMYTYIYIYGEREREREKERDRDYMLTAYLACNMAKTGDLAAFTAVGVSGQLFLLASFHGYKAERERERERWSEREREGVQSGRGGRWRETERDGEKERGRDGEIFFSTILSSE